MEPFITDEHRVFRRSVRDFVENEILPHAAEWDEAGSFPRDLYLKAGKLGYWSNGVPEEYGGLGYTDPFLITILSEEMARVGSGGIPAGLGSNAIAIPPISAAGSDELRAELLPRLVSGEAIGALAVTEPGGGSDVASITTRAQRDGDSYLVNGEKTFITSGIRADYLTTAVRTGSEGASGISVLVIPTDLPGITRTPLEKMGWWASDTASISFTDVRVPAHYLVGAENMGFLILMANFNFERLMLIAGMNGASRVLYEDALDWARSRNTFGRPLSSRQVIRHKLVEMDRQINAAKAIQDILAWRLSAGDSPVAELAEAKVTASLTMEFCAREAAQILGGASFIRGNRVERIYREVRVNAIGGGSEEIMRDLAARQLGI
jgi:acyl-CoA dehydrogenase